jgi:hypothetical protein
MQISTGVPNLIIFEFFYFQIQDTDRRIAGTYKKSLKKTKENTRQKETSKKVSYDVIYPSVGE